MQDSHWFPSKGDGMECHWVTLGGQEGWTTSLSRSLGFWDEKLKGLDRDSQRGMKMVQFLVTTRATLFQCLQSSHWICIQIKSWRLDKREGLCVYSTVCSLAVDYNHKLESCWMHSGRTYCNSLYRGTCCSHYKKVACYPGEIRIFTPLCCVCGVCVYMCLYVCVCMCV